MLIIGLTTEAVIFFISAFEKPASDYEWSRVYPELAESDDIPAAGSKKSRTASNLSPTQELDKMLEEAKIGPDLLQSLGDGMRRLSETAGSLNTAVDAAGATAAYSNQLNAAAKNMEALNALYAVQLENTTNQVEVQNSLMEKLGASISDSDKLGGEVSKMVQNVSALNNVYGNMLAAMGAKN
jgi:gliding motility-associated protein GldL